VAEALAVIEVDPLLWSCLSAVDLCRMFVAQVEQWAVEVATARHPTRLV
jgi:hypothetical protein